MGTEPKQDLPSENYIRVRNRKSEDGGSRDLSYPELPEPLEVGTYDNHTHLEIADGENPMDYREHLELSNQAGILGAVQVGGSVETSIWSARTAAIEPRLLAAVALHPNVAAEYSNIQELDNGIAEIAKLAKEPRVRAVGETGLDYFRTTEELLFLQQHSFEAHIQIAKENNIALQIHDRDAHEDVVNTLLRVGAPERTVFHCFSGDRALAEILIEHGWYASFSGTLTFKKNQELRDALAILPPELVLVETDAPFLTPEPFRGRPNSPYLIGLTVRRMAEVRGIPVNAMATQITANTEAVYGLWAEGL
ncbi:MAG: TatD family deoxyribonuclease [Micrococcales bacterium]|nr:TatD family deoxyribonuclease [Actinomycetota bacterium]NCA07546.1 TatD family deoxyribonuclease [Micrococcales bacterium]